jgi:hypothetical protein
MNFAHIDNDSSRATMRAFLANCQHDEATTTGGMCLVCFHRATTTTATTTQKGGQR